MKRGYVIMAQNTAKTDYVKCAAALAYSIKNVMPSANVSVITDDPCDYSVFDTVIPLPYGDINSDWKLSNDWQVYWASPYEYTIKLEADMYLPRSIDYWWSALEHRDLNICTTIRNQHNHISNVKFYRQIFERSNLPDTYNAITYFKKSKLAQEFYITVRDIFENWDSYKKLLTYCPDDIATTDVVYGIAARIIGHEHCTLPHFTDMSMIHMKQRIINSTTTKWADEFVYEIYPDVFRINTIPQMYPVHYHVKSFSDTILKELGHE